jgi:hypothetical protein
MPPRFACGHPCTEPNVIVSKTLTGPRAGRVQYCCRTCHTEAQRACRARQRRAREQSHTWTVALQLDDVRDVVAERFHARTGKPVRVRSEQLLAVEVYCSRCRRTFPADGPCVRHDQRPPRAQNQR